MRPGTRVAVSQSGESVEVVRLAEGRSPGPGDAPTLVSITNGLDNALARRADVALDTRAGTEVGPSTITFASALVVLSAVSAVLLGDTPDQAALMAADRADQAASAMEALLAQPRDDAARLLGWLGDRPTMALLGRGAGRAASEMGGLLLKEVARFPAESLEAGQFRHGPLELAGPNLAAVIVAVEPATRAIDERLANDLLRAGAGVLFVYTGQEAPEGAETFALPPVDRSLAPAVAMIPLQLLAWALALREGRDPVALRIASKVTTRE